MHNSRSFPALALALLLAACGGGGGSGGAPVVSPAPTTQTPSPTEGNIVTSVPAPTYAAGSGNLSIFNAINALRSKIGSGLLAQSLLLDKSAGAHWSYINQNGISELHGETAGKPGYTGVRAGDRIAAAGYTASVSGEAIFSTVGTDKYMTCVAEWANSVYHAALLFASTIDIGVAANNFNPAEGASTLCVVDVATSTTQTAQLPGAGSIRAYPYANQADVPFVFFNRTETPTPVPDLVEAGTPVTVSFETRGMAVTAPIAISQFTLTPAGGTAVEARILVNKGGKLGPVIASNGPALTDDGNMQGFTATLVPVLRLKAATAYNVALIAVVDGKTINKSWTFTTAAQ
ncbi:CAP domain-containing protein [Pseudoduganella sp. R-31]|uniref:CAP domain-containing protein n=1 Tax=unclassified Pseudoduganella TaxID=2637179 RepID=UPI003CF76ADD